MKWVALFSQTGSEIETLSNKIGRVPDYIYTNNFDSSNSKAVKAKHKDIMSILVDKHKHDLITLHGYLRIIPEKVCFNCSKMYNGHPGLITEYPVLRGIDPQERIEPWMSYIGSVVHRVIPKVDGGKVVSYAKVKNTGGDYYNILRETSLEAWEQFFENY